MKLSGNICSSIINPIRESTGLGHGIHRTPNGLLRALGLDPERSPCEILHSADFPMLVPESYAQRMSLNTWDDPLLRQILPLAEEMLECKGFSNDPVGDAASGIMPGLLYKYKGRVLLFVSDRCAMHCRFCFRRNTRLPEAVDWDLVWDYIAADASINEVILSGGDPLCLDVGLLSAHIDKAIAIPHIQTVRIHTRLPIADPDLVNEPLIEPITRIVSIKTCIVVIHANHSAELVGECAVALGKLRAAGALLLNQSVLLKGVNDSVGALEALSHALISHHVLPYYLHQLDRVNGARHFEVEEKRGRKIIDELRRRLPGYAVPRYVREMAGEASKIPL